MVLKCSFQFCKNEYQTNGNLSFFRFPKNIHQFSEWCKRAGREELLTKFTPNQKCNLRLCEDHFLKDDIKVFDNGRKNIKPGCLPKDAIIFHVPGKQRPWNKKTSTTDYDISEEILTVELSVGHNIKGSSSRSSDSPDSVAISLNEFDIGLDTAHEITMASIYKADPTVSVNFENDSMATIISVKNKENTPPVTLQSSPQRSPTEWYRTYFKINKATNTDKVVTKNKGSQTNVTIGTPRKVKMRKDMGKIRASLHHYRKRVAALQQRKEKVTDEKVIEHCKSRMSPQALELVIMLLNEKKRKQYSPQAKVLAMTLYYTGRCTYNLLRKFITLPGISTLRRWVRKIKVSPGVNTDIFSILKAKGFQMEEVEKICVLYIDEIALKTGLQYRKGDEYIVGFEDYGNDQRIPNSANHAVVAMIRGLRSNWKQPVAYVFTRNAIKEEHLRPFLNDCLGKLKEAGFTVVAITTDQGSNFKKTFKNMGVNEATPFFIFDDQKVFVFADVPHLIKSMRNTLMKHNIATPEGISKWEHIQRCHEIDKRRKEESRFVLLPKISDNHIYVPPFGGKMKVSLAAQVLSYSVCTALKTMSNLIDDKLISESFATSEFCLKVNNLFDVLNSSNLVSSSPYKKTLKINSEGWKCLEDSFMWISNLQVLGKLKTVPCFLGWKQSIRATMELLKYLIEKYNWKFLLTRRLCQDGLENFFGAIRRRGALRTNPDCMQFQDAFRSLCFQSIMQQPVKGNCLSDTGEILLKFSRTQMSDETSISLDDSIFSIANDEENHKLKTSGVKNNFLKSSENDILERNGIIYVGGYLAKRVNRFHPKCPKCKISMETKDYSGDDKTFLMLKAFSPDPTIGLVQSTGEFHDYIVRCENVLVKVLNKNFLQKDLGKKKNKMQLYSMRKSSQLFHKHFRENEIKLHPKI